MPWIYSTATNDTQYRVYNPPRPGALPSVKRKILIKGGANRPAHRTLITPYGIGTEVSDDELDILQSNESFKRHVAAGFMKVSAKKVDPEKPAADMEKRDGAAPFVEADFAKGGKGPKTSLTKDPFK